MKYLNKASCVSVSYPHHLTILTHSDLLFPPLFQKALQHYQGHKSGKETGGDTNLEKRLGSCKLGFVLTTAAALMVIICGTNWNFT